VRAAACALSATAWASAQAERLVAVPQDTVTYSYDAVTAGSAMPLGGFPLHGGSRWYEVRWQQLIPNHYLPTTPGRITAISAVCADVSNPGTYRRLRIALGATSATALSMTFANNLPAPSTVLDQRDLSVGWQAMTWHRIQFDVPFPYDGKSSLVLELRKEATTTVWCTHAVPWNPRRVDLPPAVYATGWIGSGAADATMADSTSDLLQVRLHFETDATLTLRSDRVPSGSRNVFALGGTFEIAVRAPATSPQVVFMDAAFAPRYEVPGIRGQGLLLPTLLLPPRTVPLGEIDLQRFTIPPDPGLVGATVALQAAVLDAVARTPLFTNGADLVVSGS
jgi:hypothetical protein